MDYSSVSSEFIESLEYLRPPVKDPKKNNTEFLRLNSRVKNVDVLKDFRTQIPKKCRCNELQKIQKNPLESSTSLIAKRTGNKEIAKQTGLSCTTLHSTDQKVKKKLIDQIFGVKQKPIIKVTVIPKTNIVQPVHLKRRRKAKRIETTASNHESFTQFEKQYLSLANAVYNTNEVKSIGSAVFTADAKTLSKNDIPLEQISCLQLVLDSLNMDNKKERKNKKFRKNNVTPAGSEEFQENHRRLQHLNGCKCYENNKNSSNIDNRKSCIRITGVVGLNEQNRYILKCATNINDKPVEESIIHPYNNCLCTERFENRTLKICNVENCLTECYRRKFRNPHDNATQTDSYTDLTASKDKASLLNDIPVQADLSRERKSFKHSASQETKQTQVNFDVVSCKNINIHKSNAWDESKAIQCYCTTAHSANVDSTYESEDGSKSIKRGESPLVVISVYPVQNQNRPFNTYPDRETKSTAPATKKNKTFTMKNMKEEKSYITKPLIFNSRNAAATSRTPRSPTRSSRPPSRSSSRSPKSPITPKKSPSPLSRCTSPLSKSPGSHNANKGSIFEPEYKYNSGNRPNTSRNPDYKPIVKIVKRQAKLLQDNANNSNDSPRINSKGNNDKDQRATKTDHLTKKQLVDNYTKHLTTFLDKVDINKNIHSLKPDSKISISIDGDNEYYEMMIHQGNDTSDFKVKRTLKNTSGVNNTCRQSYCSPKLSRKQEYENSAPAPKNESEVKVTSSRFQPRDSIELTHRKDGSRCGGNRFVGKTNLEKNNKGDDCAIINPVERDQEIRALLGIKKRKQVPNVPTVALSMKAAGCYDTRGINKGLVLKMSRSLKCRKNDLTAYFNTANEITAQSLTDQNSVCVLYQRELTEEDSILLENRYLFEEIKNTPNDIVENYTISSPVNDLPNIETVIIGKQDVQCQSNFPSKSRYEVSNSLKVQCSNNVYTQYEIPSTHQTSLYQQVVLKRNIQVFLQLEQFSKHKPIVLSRKQYDKVKRRLENSMANKHNSSIVKNSFISLGDVRKKRKRHRRTFCDKSVQAAFSENLSADFLDTNKKILKVDDSRSNKSRQTTSLAVRCTSVSSYMKNVNVSSINVEAGSVASLADFASPSIHTIFKGRKRCATPNLGHSNVSVNSIEDELINDTAKTKNVFQNKRKPFLQRLISCLVMRSARFTGLGPIPPPSNLPATHSSVDSYHINTSLEGMELSSSIFDTSISFYSNHSVYPINSKIKRGFLASVREFLSKGKS